jgi:hypothetical protein
LAASLAGKTAKGVRPIMNDATRWLAFGWGGSRWVLLVGHYAIKVPRCSNQRSYPNDASDPTFRKRITQGRNCNRAERAAWRERLYPNLCPIIFADPFGWIVVMQRASPITQAEFDEWSDGDDWPYVYGTQKPYEDDVGDAGRLPDGRLVMVDYGVRGYLVGLASAEG